MGGGGGGPFTTVKSEPGGPFSTGRNGPGVNFQSHTGSRAGRTLTHVYSNTPFQGIVWLRHCTGAVCMKHQVQ